MAKVVVALQYRELLGDAHSSPSLVLWWERKRGHPVEWFRAHHGISNDLKLALIALKSGATRCQVGWLWVTLLDRASQASERGNVGHLDPEELSLGCEIPTAVVEKIIRTFRDKGLIDEDNNLTAWDKRQPIREREDWTSAERQRRRRDKIRASGGTSAGYLRHYRAVFERDHGRCVYCGETNVRRLCLDHGFPIFLGGDDDIANLYLACKRCNSGKSGRTPDQAKFSFISAETEALYRQNERRLVALLGGNNHCDSHGITVTVTTSPIDEIDREEKTATIEEDSRSTVKGSSFEESSKLKTTRQNGACVTPNKKTRNGRTTEQIRQALGEERMKWWAGFWSVYPHHGGTKEAMDAFERKVHERDLALKIYRRAVAYAAQVSADPEMKVKWAQGWLNGERWLDDPSPQNLFTLPPVQYFDPLTIRHTEEAVK